MGFLLLDRSFQFLQTRLCIGKLPLKRFQAGWFVIHRLVDLRKCRTAAKQKACTSNRA